VTRRNRPIFGLAIALASASSSGLALAAPRVSYSLEYKASENCPNEEAFVQAIQVRAPVATRTEAATAQVVFEAHISAASGFSRGFLLVRLAGGEATRRDVPDASCSEIVASMAVIAALVIEGLSESGRDAPATPLPSEAVPPASAPSESEKVPPPSAKPVDPKRAPAARLRPAERLPRDASSSVQMALPQSPASGVRWGLTVATGFESASAHELTPALAFGVEVSARRRVKRSASARLTGLYAQSDTQHTDDGTARFRWLAARVALCPFWFGEGSVALRPCVELDAGELRAKGGDTTNPQTPSLLWLGGGAALHGEIGLGPVLALEGQLGGRVLARPGRFVFLPNDTLAHDTGRFSLGALIGLVVRLP
jgi:hypothetical protein